MKDKLKIVAICALIAFIAGPVLLICLTGGGILKTFIACAVAAAVLGVLIFALTYVLDGKSIKKTVPVYILAGIVSLVTIFSVLIINIAPTVLFRPHFDEDSYEDLCEMEEEGYPAPQQISAAGGSITGWRLPARGVPEDQARPAVLFFMGNGMESSNYAAYILDHEDIYRNLLKGSDFIFFDYPQYGRSEGDLNAASIKQMAMDAYETVSSLSTTSEVYVAGYSLGTGFATYVASETDVSGLILMAPYKDTFDLYNNYLNLFHGPFRLLVTFRMNSAKFAEKVNCPVLIFASDEDQVIPYRSSRELFASFSSASVDFVTVSGADHNDFPALDSVFERVAEFVTEG